MAVFGTNELWKDGKVHVQALKVDIKSLTTASPDALTADNDGQTIHFNRAAGVDVTLPAASGSGIRYRFIVATTVTSNDINIRCAGTDEFAGVIYQVDTDTTDTVAAYPALAADNFDVISLNGSTTGGLAGDWIEVEDIASGVWALRGHINGTGTVATPLAAT